MSASPHSLSRVLLIRVNAAVEIFQTRQAADIVRARFPGAQVTALATPQTETLSVLRTDPRLDEVLLFPPEGSDPAAKSPAAFRQFLVGQRFAAVVVCCGSTPGLDYNRHILSALVCPGRRFFLDGAGRLFPVMSARGLAVLRSALAGQVGQRVVQALLRKITPHLRPTRSHSSVPLAEALAAGQIRRALCIRLDHIGDLTLCLPAINAMQNLAPNLATDALVYPTSASVLEGQDVIHETLTYDAPRFSRKPRKTGLRALGATVRALRQRRYDLVIDLHGDDTARLLAFLSGARYRLGPERIDSEPPGKPNLAFLLTDSPRDFEPPSGPPRHAIHCALKIIEPLGTPFDSQAPLPHAYMKVSEAARTEVGTILESLGISERFAVIHSASSVAIKDWRPERFAEVAERLRDEYGLTVLLTGAPGDGDGNRAILGHAGSQTRLYDVSAHVPLRLLAALLARAEILVTVDTGTMHIASAVGTPLVALFLPWYAARFCPTSPAQEVLLPAEGRLLTQENLAGADTMLLDSISVPQVMDAVARVWAKRPSEATHA
jgi:ADP-heptose:LPS heptosyltransferase